MVDADIPCITKIEQLCLIKKNPWPEIGLHFRPALLHGYSEKKNKNCDEMKLQREQQSVGVGVGLVCVCGIASSQSLAREKQGGMSMHLVFVSIQK